MNSDSSSKKWWDWQKEKEKKKMDWDTCFYWQSWVVLFLSFASMCCYMFSILAAVKAKNERIALLRKPNKDETEELISQEFMVSFLTGIADILLVLILYMKTGSQLDFFHERKRKKTKEERQAVVLEV